MGRLGSAVLLAGLLGLAACSDTIPLVPGLPSVEVPEKLRIVETVDTPGNVIERGLSACPKRIEAGEADCVKKALADGHVTVAALIAMVPGCHAGAICRYSYKTDDSIGFSLTGQSHFVQTWKVDFDLRKSPATIDAVPVTVTI